jgi:hypothetical protein
LSDHPPHSARSQPGKQTNFPNWITSSVLMGINAGVQRIKPIEVITPEKFVRAIVECDTD